MRNGIFIRIMIVTGGVVAFASLFAAATFSSHSAVPSAIGSRTGHGAAAHRAGLPVLAPAGPVVAGASPSATSRAGAKSPAVSPSETSPASLAAASLAPKPPAAEPPGAKPPGTESPAAAQSAAPGPSRPAQGTVGAPAAPTGLHASVSGTTVRLSWNAVSGAADYEIRLAGSAIVVATPSDPSFIYDATLTDTSATLDDMPTDGPNGDNYWWGVAAINSAGETWDAQTAAGTANTFVLT